MANYSKKSKNYVKETMHEMKEEKIRSSSGDKVTNLKQATAIRLSEAREDGVKIP